MPQNSFPLKSLNSFSLTAQAKQLVCVKTLSELVDFCKKLPEHFYILGGGSNSLFIDDFKGTILCPQFSGIQIVESETHYHIQVQCGENWHQLVQYCLQKNIAGLENLALIPGNCGAAPIQNIGAYGIEFADICEYVEWFDFITLKQQKILKRDCHFGYRNSIFKQELKDKGVITSIGIKLPKQWQPKLNYQGLKQLGSKATPQAVFDKVVEIRQSKLPDPDILPNAGSFFKNPIVDFAVAESIKTHFPDMPAYDAGQGKVKLAAGWLIEQCQLKGTQIGGAAVHKLQALVLVNIDNAQGIDVINLAKFVQDKVRHKFNVILEPEVRIISKYGEVAIDKT